MTGQAGDTYTERAAFAEILQWSGEQPAWQQDALRRLIEGGAAPHDDAAIDQLTALCLDPKLPATPLAKEHLTGGAAAGQAISLVSISNVAGVNALVPGQKLEFAPAGLTVVYGDNGSGKSGYVRVLKHACRSRDDDNAILPDIQDTSGTPQAATIAFARGGVGDTFSWTPKAAHDELPAVSIFNSRSANIHVEKTNAVAYNPYPMQVMAALADVCDKVKQKIAEKIDALDRQTPLSISQPHQPRRDRRVHPATIGGRLPLLPWSPSASWPSDSPDRLGRPWFWTDCDDDGITSSTENTWDEVVTVANPDIANALRRLLPAELPTPQDHSKELTSQPKCKPAPDNTIGLNEHWKDFEVSLLGKFLVAVASGEGGYGNGAAHGYEGRPLRYYDLRTGKEVPFLDLFTKRGQDLLMERVKADISKESKGAVPKECKIELSQVWGFQFARMSMIPWRLDGRRDRTNAAPEDLRFWNISYGAYAFGCTGRPGYEMYDLPDEVVERELNPVYVDPKTKFFYN